MRSCAMESENCTNQLGSLLMLKERTNLFLTLSKMLTLCCYLDVIVLGQHSRVQTASFGNEISSNIEVGRPSGATYVSLSNKTVVYLNFT